MYCLTTLHRINAIAAAKPAAETETTRHCSYCGDVETGVVLHSAKHRSTAFLNPGEQARKFLTEWFATNSVERHDAIVEAYFAAVPTGKQHISK